MKVLRNVNFLLILLFSLSCTTPEQQQPTIERVDVDTFEAKLNTLDNAFLIDVRTPGEYKSGHIDGAKNIDFNQTDNMKMAFEKLDHNQHADLLCGRWKKQ